MTFLQRLLDVVVGIGMIWVIYCPEHFLTFTRSHVLLFIFRTFAAFCVLGFILDRLLVP